MTDSALAYPAPEDDACVEIDRMLEVAGWAVQNYGAVNLAAGRAVAVHEVVLAHSHGRADYLLFVDGNAVGALEAKKEGETLTGVVWQAAKYVDGTPVDVPAPVEGADDLQTLPVLGGLAVPIRVSGCEVSPQTKRCYRRDDPITLNQWQRPTAPVHDGVGTG